MLIAHSINTGGAQRPSSSAARTRSRTANAPAAARPNRNASVRKKLPGGNSIASISVAWVSANRTWPSERIQIQIGQKIVTQPQPDPLRIECAVRDDAAQTFWCRVLAEIEQGKIGEGEWVAPAAVIHDPGHSTTNASRMQAGRRPFARLSSGDEQQSERGVKSNAKRCAREQGHAGADRHPAQCRTIEASRGGEASDRQEDERHRLGESPIDGFLIDGGAEKLYVLPAKDDRYQQRGREPVLPRRRLSVQTSAIARI